jgi:hypothetical protein
MGVFATGWAVVAGPHRVAAAIFYGICFSVSSAWFAIGPSLRKREAPEPAPADAVETNTRPAGRVLLHLAGLVAVLGAAAAFLPAAVLWIGCCGLFQGAVWLGAAEIVRYRELRWFHGRLIVGSPTSRFRPSTTPFYLIPEANHSHS